MVYEFDLLSAGAPLAAVALVWLWRRIRRASRPVPAQKREGENMSNPNPGVGPTIGEQLADLRNQIALLRVATGARQSPLTAGQPVHVDGKLFKGKGEVEETHPDGAVSVRADDGRKLRYTAQEIQAGKVKAMDALESRIWELNDECLNEVREDSLAYRISRLEEGGEANDDGLTLADRVDALESNLGDCDDLDAMADEVHRLKEGLANLQERIDEMEEGEEGGGAPVAQPQDGPLSQFRPGLSVRLDGKLFKGKGEVKKVEGYKVFVRAENGKLYSYTAQDVRAGAISLPGQPKAPAQADPDKALPIPPAFNRVVNSFLALVRQALGENYRDMSWMGSSVRPFWEEVRDSLYELGVLAR